MGTRSVPPQLETPPDGGWGWVVTFSSFLIMLLVDGVGYSFGIFFPEYLRHFSGSKGKTQMLPAILVGTMYGIGPVTGAFVNRYGSRRVATFGSLVFGAGLFLSTFSSNLDVVILCYGVIGGIGYGMMFLPALVTVSMYFNKRRALATGLVVCGSGVGSFVFPPLYGYLLETYGLRGTVWIMSAIVVNGVVFASAYRPLVHNVPLSKIRYSANETCSSDETGGNERSIEASSCSICGSLTEMFDVSLLSRPVVIMCGVACFLGMLGFYVPYNFLPALASDLDLSTTESSWLISAIGISNTISRVLIGYVADKSWTNNIMINNVSLMIGGLATFFVPYYTTFNQLVVYAVIFGASMAVFMSLMTIILVELLGVQKLTSTFGWMALCMGIAILIGSPVAGALSDITGDYNIAFYFAGTAIGFAGVTGIPLRQVARWEQSRRLDVLPDQTDTRLCNARSSVYCIH